MNCQECHPTLQWDIFCRVIDNFGDIGVSWRLASNLVQRSQHVRLWIDDPSALDWMAAPGLPGIQICQWSEPAELFKVTAGNVLVATFGCAIDPEFVANYARQVSLRGERFLWINLEYLSAERYVERSHQLPSPVLSGPASGQTLHYFYPGFTPATGGLLREVDLLQRQRAFDRSAWLTQIGVDWRGKRLISLFCYEPQALRSWLDDLIDSDVPSCLLVTAGRASAACQAILADETMLERLRNKPEQLSFFYLPKLSQIDFDHLLWACEVNFVRGEDSLVRALWAGKPFVWHIYPQADGVHQTKLKAFLDWLVAPPAMRNFYRFWNSNTQPPEQTSTQASRESDSSKPDGPLAVDFDPDSWLACIRQARARLLQQPDLTSCLLNFCLKNH